MRRVVPLLSMVVLLAAAPAAPQHWPRFRGPQGSGIADSQNLPESWNVASGENVRWRVALPGTSHSSPVVWEDRVFVTTAISAVDEELVLGDEGGIDLAVDDDPFTWRLYCLDKATGEVVWQRDAYAERPRATRHVKASQDNATPATDGNVVVTILGSQGLRAWDLDGHALWEVDLGVLDPGLFGDPTSHWGHASSPVIWRDRVFVQVDRHADSFVAAYELATGSELWRVERNEKPIWATPVVHESGKRSQLIVLGGDWERGLDPITGDELWRYARDLEVKTSSPIVAGSRIVVSGGYRATPLVALPVDAAGEITEPLWESEPGGPYTPTPIVYGDRIFFTRNTGILTVLSLATGERLHRERLGGNFSASPVAADGRIYFPSEEGIVTVVEAAAEPGVVVRVDMGESIMASPALSDGLLLLRTRGHLTAVGRPPEAASQ